MNALKLQGFDGRLGRGWRLEIDETVAFALVGILVENGFGRDDGAEPFEQEKKTDRKEKINSNEFGLE